MLTLFETMEDWDNAELPEDERIEQLRDVAGDYNEENGTDYNLDLAVRNYEKWKRMKFEPEY